MMVLSLLVPSPTKMSLLSGGAAVFQYQTPHFHHQNRRIGSTGAKKGGAVWSSPCFTTSNEYLSQSSHEGQHCCQKVMQLTCWLVCHFEQLLSDIIMTNPVLTAWNRLQKPCDDYFRHCWAQCVANINPFVPE